MLQDTGRHRFLASATILSFLLFAQPGWTAQSDVGLRVQIVRGDGARNPLQQTSPVQISVRVTDRNRRPVPGATVVFTAPDKGASGDFDGEKTARAITDENGLAVVSNYRSNNIEGRYPILVQAEYMGEIASGIMVQTNVAPKKSHGKLIAIIAVAGAAGAALAARGAGGGGSSPSNPTNSPGPQIPTIPTITFGGSSVGGPR